MSPAIAQKPPHISLLFGVLGGAFAALFCGQAVAAVDEEKAAPSTEAITNGLEAQTCQFPSSVAVVAFGEPYCTGTLVAPDLVLFAAHCITEGSGEPQAFHFGEDAYNPARIVDVERCDFHPEYLRPRGIAYPDLAFCTLVEPVEDVAITPIAMGCEVESIERGTPIAISGFGAIDASIDEDSGAPIPVGVGIKHFTKQWVDDIREEEGYIDLIGSGTNSACFGDSGGPAFIKLPSGEVRTLGAASVLYFAPGTTPDPNHICGTGVSYSLAYPFIDWLEEASGRDLTPCFDQQGNWEPTAECQGFAVDPELGTGEWSNGCTNGGVSAYVATCGPPYDGEGNESSAGESDAGDSAESTESGEEDDDGSEGEEQGSGDDGPQPPPLDSEDSEGSDDGDEGEPPVQHLEEPEFSGNESGEEGNGALPNGRSPGCSMLDIQNDPASLLSIFGIFFVLLHRRKA